ncbi:MAG: hypothetical protein CL663_00010 [Bacteroidetes bacterium]|nr:hypothetical protein [Bacteroidota bacterium]
MSRRKARHIKRTSKRKKPSKQKRFFRYSILFLIIILVIGYLSYKTWERRENHRLETGSQIVNTSMGDIEYLSLGEGPVMLFSHMGGSGYDNAFLFEDLTDKGFRIICPSRPGYLRTPLVDGADFVYQADLFAALLEKLKIKEKVFVMAYSSGGPAAIEFAIRYPHQTRGLILHSAITNKFPSDKDMQDNARLLSVMISDIWQDLLCWGYSISSNVFPQRMVGELLERGSTFDRQSCKIISGELVEDKKTEMLLQKFEASTVPLSRRTDGLENDLKWAADFNPQLSKLNVPVFISHSKIDKIVHYSHYDYFIKRNTNSEMWLYDGYGHSIFLGPDWNTLIDKTAKFINKHSKRKSIFEISPKEKPEEDKVEEITWVNRSDGALLVIKGELFSLEFPSVDGGTTYNGRIDINEDEMFFTFNDASGYCNSDIATYKFKIKDKVLELKHLKDKCKRRRTQFTAGWFKI